MDNYEKIVYMVFILASLFIILLAYILITDYLDYLKVCEQHNGNYISADQCMIKENGVLVRYGIAKDVNGKLDIYRWASEVKP